jgi:hypothetical protein
MDTTRITTYPNPFLVNVPELQNVIQNASGETINDLQTRVGQIEEMVLYDTKELAANTIRSFDTGTIVVSDPLVGGATGQGTASLSTSSTTATAFVDAGVPVDLAPLRVQVSMAGNRSLQLATTSGTLTADMNSYGSDSGGYVPVVIQTSQSITTSFSYIAPAHSYASQGDVQYATVCDKSNNRAYRITCMYGPAYVGNMISVEQL